MHPNKLKILNLTALVTIKDKATNADARYPIHSIQLAILFLICVKVGVEEYYFSVIWAFFNLSLIATPKPLLGKTAARIIS